MKPYWFLALGILTSPVGLPAAESPGSIAPAKPDEEAQAEKLISAVLVGADREHLQELLNEGLNINSRIKAGLSAYQAAVLRGETGLAQFLAEHGARTNAPLPDPAALAEALFSRIATNNAPGLAVLVAQHGRVLFEKGYGLAEVHRAIPITPQTKFRIGSITKQFTAAAILKLQEQGKLNVQDKLTKFFPSFPRGDEVTLQHLLTHTSGIHSYTDKPGFKEKVTAAVTPSALIDSFKNDPYDFAPGKKWHYDNSGYFLLGAIIEKVSGKPYEEFLRQNFFQPLGMTNTGVHHAGRVLEHEALGYQFTQGRFTNALDWDMSWAGGAGALYSTVEDLYRWNEGLFGGRVLSSPSLKAAWTPVKTEENKDDQTQNGYGFGWGLSQLRSVLEISHGGGLDGFSSFLLRLPQQEFTVVVLANALPGPPGLEPAQLAHLAAELYLGDKLPPRSSSGPELKLASSSLDALVGRYDYGSAVLTVSREGDRLYAQLTGQPRVQIFPKSETNFFWKVVDAQVTFVKDQHGRVLRAIHHQNGATLSAPRIPDLKETQISAADIEAVLGKYDYGAGKAILTVSHEGDHVFAQLTGQPKIEIFPKSATDYFWKVVDAQLTFVKDHSGKVTKAIHHQSGHVLEAPKIE